MAPLELGRLGEEAGLAFLRAELSERGFGVSIEASDDELHRILEATGGMPLAMKLVVGQVVAGSLELGRLLSMLAAVEHGESRSEASVYSFYNFIYRATWEMMSDPAKRMLFLMTILPGAVGTPVDAIRQISGLEPSEADLAIAELSRFNLLERVGPLSNPEYFLHPLTANFVRTERMPGSPPTLPQSEK